MVKHQRAVADIVSKDPYVDSFMSSIGGNGGNQGRIFIRLKPRNQRPHVDGIIQEMRPKFAQVPGIMVYMQNLPPIRIGGQLTKSQYQFTLTGTTGYNYAVDASTDTIAGTWLPLATNSSPYTFTDNNASGFTRRFYRARWVP